MVCVCVCYATITAYALIHPFFDILILCVCVGFCLRTRKSIKKIKKNDEKTMVESSAPYTNIKICTHKHWGKNQRVEGLMTKKKTKNEEEKKRNGEKGWKHFSCIFQQVHVVRVCGYVFLVLLFSNHRFFMSHFLLYFWEFWYGWFFLSLYYSLAVVW